MPRPTEQLADGIATGGDRTLFIGPFSFLGKSKRKSPAPSATPKTEVIPPKNRESSGKFGPNPSAWCWGIAVFCDGCNSRATMEKSRVERGGPSDLGGHPDGFWTGQREKLSRNGLCPPKGDAWDRTARTSWKRTVGSFGNNSPAWLTAGLAPLINHWGIFAERWGSEICHPLDGPVRRRGEGTNSPREGY
jgi:hypothetical protein